MTHLTGLCNHIASWVKSDVFRARRLDTEIDVELYSDWTHAPHQVQQTQRLRQVLQNDVVQRITLIQNVSVT
jgi:hypothetical protein